MELWIARDSNGELWIYDHKPIKFKNKFHTDARSKESNAYELPKWLFNEITFENSPQQVELKLKSKLSFEEMEELIDDLI